MQEASVILRHLCPAKVGKNPLDETLAQGQVVQPALLFEWQQRKPLHHRPREHAGARARGHAVLVVDFDAEQARRRRVLLVRLDTNDKLAGR